MLIIKGFLMHMMQVIVIKEFLMHRLLHADSTLHVVPQLLDVSHALDIVPWMLDVSHPCKPRGLLPWAKVGESTAGSCKKTRAVSSATRSSSSLASTEPRLSWRGHPQVHFVWDIVLVIFRVTDGIWAALHHKTMLLNEGFTILLSQPMYSCNGHVGHGRSSPLVMGEACTGSQ